MYGTFSNARSEITAGRWQSRPGHHDSSSGILGSSIPWKIQVLSNIQTTSVPMVANYAPVSCGLCELVAATSVTGTSLSVSGAPGPICPLQQPATAACGKCTDVVTDCIMFVSAAMSCFCTRKANQWRQSAVLHSCQHAGLPCFLHLRTVR